MQQTNWLLLIMALPRGRASERIAIWRELRTCGAIPIAGVYVLPAREECQEIFDALSARIEEQGGTAHTVRTAEIGGLDDAGLIARFQSERAARYQDLDRGFVQSARIGTRRQIAGARRRFDGIVAFDYFDSPARKGAERALLAAERALRMSAAGAPMPKPPDLRGKRWVTARRPGPDALACAWLIRRAVDASALIRYDDHIHPGETAFAMAGAVFQAQDGQTAFDSLCDALSVHERAMQVMRRLVRALELPGKSRGVPEAHGIAAALRGWRLTQSLGDAELEARSRVLFDGAYASYALER
jgi:hypothetical protein